MASKNENKTLKPFKVGNSRRVKIIIRDAVTKAAVDITGDKFYFTVKDSVNLEDSDAEVQSSVVAPADDNSTNGIAIIPVSVADTSAVTPGSYYYDIAWLKLASEPGDKVTVQDGNVSFQEAITRAQA